MAKKSLLKDRNANTLYPNIYTECILDFPQDKKSGQVLTHNGTNAEWANIPLLDLVSYGVMWKPDISDPNLTRVGNMNYHKTLPIQSQMKGCIYNPKEKKIVYWLDEDNWNYKKGGNPNKGEVENLARLDGYDGEVMIYVPEFWIRSWDEDDRREVRISTMKIDDTWEHQPALFIGAYKDTVLNTVPENMGYLSTLEVNTAICVANSESYCRGGNNNTTNDADTDIFKRNLGKPRTAISRSSMRIYERKASKEILSYRQYKNIFYWLWVIEYATFNSQAPFNASLTAEGYHLGGMGAGVTTINSSHWNWYNGYCPLTPCGYTNDIGNNSGVKNMTIIFPTTEDGSTTKDYTFEVPRWRGIENPFGDIWINLDGIIIDADADNHNPVNYNYVYTTNDPSKYGDDIKNMILSGLEIHQNGYTKLFDLGTTSEIIPRLMGGNTTQYKCDFHRTGDKNTALRTVVFGGDAAHGNTAGLGCFHSNFSVSSSAMYLGFRSAFSLNK